MIEQLKEMGLKQGADITVRHSAPFCEEPHQVLGVVLSVEPPHHKVG